jgi:beta-glucanase (GH16 family)
MKQLLFLAIILVLISCSKENEDEIAARLTEWELVWSDEFDYTGLPDPNKWAFETGYVRNDETQFYTDGRLENCKVENGHLYITALNDTFNGHPVTSASIETEGIFDFKYGRVEVRAKMPRLGKGTWPAIWTLGANSSTVGWPYCGEIDIVEWTGKAPGVLLGSVYTRGSDSPKMKEMHWAHLVGNPGVVVNNFHNYAIEWDSTEIKYFFDNTCYLIVSKDCMGEEDWLPFTRAHYLKINLAMGGEIPPLGGGGPIDYTKFPYTFEVDYARYYVRQN